MDFLGMGFGEILLIFIIALLIWGPGKLPELSRTLGKTVRSLRKASLDLTSQLTRELDVEGKDPLFPRAKSSSETTKPPEIDKVEPGDGEATGQGDK